MMTKSPVVNSNTAINSYVKGFNASKPVNNVVKIVYGTRPERRKLERNLQEFQKDLLGFKKFHEEFLEASQNYHSLLSRIPYLELERTEHLSKQGVNTLEFRKSALEKINELHEFAVIKDNILLIDQLIQVNTEIHKDASKFLSYHSPVNALERGCILISDLGDEKIMLDINFHVDLTSVDNEIRGEVKDLDIIVYEETVPEVTASIREYIKEIFDELRNTKNSLLSSELKIQKEILTTFINEI